MFLEVGVSKRGDSVINDSVINIEIKLFANLREYNPEEPGGKEAVEYEIAEGSTIEDLYRELEIPEDHVKMNFVNNLKKKKDYELQDGDRVAVFPPIAGG